MHFVGEEAIADTDITQVTGNYCFLFKFPALPTFVMTEIQNFFAFKHFSS